MNKSSFDIYIKRMLPVVAFFLCICNSQILITQSLGTIVFFGFPACLYALYSQKPYTALSLDIKPDKKQLIYLMLFAVAIYPTANFLAHINELIHLPNSMSELEATLRSQHTDSVSRSENLMRVDSLWKLFQNVLVMAFLPAICEELCFRGTLQNWLAKHINIHVVILLVSITFSLLHFDLYGFIPRFVIAVMYGYILYLSKSLWLTIIAHFINNSLYLLIVFIQHNYNHLNGIEHFGILPIVGTATFIVSAIAIIGTKKTNVHTAQ